MEVPGTLRDKAFQQVSNFKCLKIFILDIVD